MTGIKIPNNMTKKMFLSIKGISDLLISKQFLDNKINTEERLLAVLNKRERKKNDNLDREKRAKLSEENNKQIALSNLNLTVYNKELLDIMTQINNKITEFQNSRK